MPQELDRILGPDAIHQGVMLETQPCRTASSRLFATAP